MSYFRELVSGWERVKPKLPYPSAVRVGDVFWENEYVTEGSPYETELNNKLMINFINGHFMQVRTKFNYLKKIIKTSGGAWLEHWERLWVVFCTDLYARSGGVAGTMLHADRHWNIPLSLVLDEDKIKEMNDSGKMLSYHNPSTSFYEFFLSGFIRYGLLPVTCWRDGLMRDHFFGQVMGCSAEENDLDHYRTYVWDLFWYEKVNLTRDSSNVVVAKFIGNNLSGHSKDRCERLDLYINGVYHMIVTLDYLTNTDNHRSIFSWCTHRSTSDIQGFDAKTGKVRTLNAEAFVEEDAYLNANRLGFLHNTARRTALVTQLDSWSRISTFHHMKDVQIHIVPFIMEDIAKLPNTAITKIFFEWTSRFYGQEADVGWVMCDYDKILRDGAKYYGNNIPTSSYLFRTIIRFEKVLFEKGVIFRPFRTASQYDRWLADFDKHAEDSVNDLNLFHFNKSSLLESYRRDQPGPTSPSPPRDDSSYSWFDEDPKELINMGSILEKIQFDEEVLVSGDDDKDEEELTQKCNDDDEYDDDDCPKTQQQHINIENLIILPASSSSSSESSSTTTTVITERTAYPDGRRVSMRKSKSPFSTLNRDNSNDSPLNPSAGIGPLQEGMMKHFKATQSRKRKQHQITQTPEEVIQNNELVKNFLKSSSQYLSRENKKKKRQNKKQKMNNKKTQ